MSTLEDFGVFLASIEEASQQLTRRAHLALNTSLTATPREILRTMRTKTTIAVCFATFFLPLFALAQAPPEPSKSVLTVVSTEATPIGPEILAKVDAVATQAVDFTARIELSIVDTAGESVTRTVSVWQKGVDKRMVKILAPPRLRGVGILSQGEGVLHLYLPAFGKVRRIAGQARGKSFFDSDFTQDDMTRTRYGDRFQAVLMEEDETYWTLRLDPVNSDDEPYHHTIVQARKADYMVASVEFFREDDGPAQRRLTATDFRVHGGLLLAHTVVAESLDKKTRSTATLSGVQVDTGLEDAFFTTRHLKRKP